MQVIKRKIESDNRGAKIETRMVKEETRREASDPRRVGPVPSRGSHFVKDMIPLSCLLGTIVLIKALSRSTILSLNLKRLSMMMTCMKNSKILAEKKSGLFAIYALFAILKYTSFTSSADAMVLL